MIILALAVQVRGQPGFLSIDCGIPEDLNYTDDRTQMFYTSDAKFVDTGENKAISTDHMTDDLLRQYQNVRFFPIGNRNCYTLTPVAKSSRYLLRASFMYGDYDGLNKPPQFDVYVGVNLWYVKLPSTADEYWRNEIIFYATTDYISVCLVTIGHGIPYISTLELRLLDNSIYQAANESQLLQLYSRHHFRPSGIIRFPDDAYDRLWSPWGHNSWTLINTSSPINLKEDNGYQPPLSVMNTAAVIPSESSWNFSFYFPTVDLNKSFQYQIFMHFAELEQLRSNELRQFNIFIDGVFANGPFSPVYLSADTIIFYSALNGLSRHTIDLCKTTSSTLPPVLNAKETFIIQKLPTPTDSKDVNAIMNIKATYQIKKDWVGDPCVPMNYAWVGVKCSYIKSVPPTIISLDLSSSGLTGELAPCLANLTSIQSLDVSNNSMTGPVPDFLAELSSLKVLNLSKNQFTGSIPTILLEKWKDGSLSLSFDNSAEIGGPSNRTVINDINPCESGSCKKRRKIVIPVLASVISAVVILTIVAFVLWKFTQRRRKRAMNQSKMVSPFEVIDLSRDCVDLIVEYCNSNNLTQKSDVYSFGVVLLELITGQPAIIRNADYEKRTLVDWASPIIAGGDIQAVVDRRLEGDYNINSLWKVAEIALACTSPRSIERPSMSDIVTELKYYIETETCAERTGTLRIDQVESTTSVASQPRPR
ncbi:putative LRR receptor-like serine/threonine-protein kinase isoform X3 [Cinnamomum micranthum f. kanehirae]|uniref:non-specific serine/threonine protein kinase n=1 Tax=Cinnamomum micranthum f. kanehirae TaxID=337451 RepID=A0A443NI27_9MAGN|nr:putative LRR receptor-like serine/threonine-protein kinase isoform X3 [Cinnamomum micranthum f. kanehirae]